jgi:phosphoribosyl 1,2-cyclic phosphodiesterase
LAKSDKERHSFSVVCLGSGSKGNATLVRYARTLLLIDNGFSCKEIVQRLARRNIEPKDITAILVTHEHSDHFKGVPAFSNKYLTPVWINSGVSLHKNSDKLKTFNLFNSHQNFSIGDIEVCPVSVPHDSREACQFVFKQGGRKIGILTDLGHITPYVIQAYENCDILLLEFNHDRDMLMSSDYPASLKSRVVGSLGHLSNEQAKDFLTHKITNKLKYLIAMHLSGENNKVEIVERCITEAGLSSSTHTLIAEQMNGFDWLVLE